MITIPLNWKYKNAHLKGRPRHEKYSDFWRRHIPMDHTHRAKIFTAFDALKGFDEAIEAKEVQYVMHKVRSEEQINDLIRRLKIASEATVRYFVPCSDPNNDAFEDGLGTYQTVTGTVWRVDSVTQTLEIADQMICFEDIDDIILPYAGRMDEVS